MLPATDILIALKWYLVLIVLGVVGWSLVIDRCQPLADRGYALGKAAGLIVIGALSWILSVLNIVPFNNIALWVMVLLGFYMVYHRRRLLLQTLRQHWRRLLVIEVVCLVIFGGAVLLRAQNPMQQGIEKFMDSAILNGLLRTKTGTPLDTWYAGSTINYYYFGHWLVATVAKLSGTDSSAAFNLSFATTIATAGTSLFAAGWSLTKRLKGGVIVTFLALVASNFQPFLALIQHQAHYFFFNSGRFTDYRINEYPLYSISLGDLHAHMLSLMLTTPLILIILVYVKNKLFRLSTAVMMGILLGLMAPTNSFDTLTCGFLVGLVILAVWYRTSRRTWRQLWQPALNVALGAVVPLSVFLLHFKQPTGGVGFAQFQIPLGNILMQFGAPFILLGFSIAVALYWQARARGKNKQIKLPAIFKKLEDETVLTVVLGFAALCLIVVPEVIFLKDIYFYLNPPYKLANTEFKVWYTAWILCALAAGSAITLVYNRARLTHKKYFVGASVLVLVIIFCITIVGTFDGISGVKDNTPATINGIGYLNTTIPDEYKTVVWANKNIKGQPTVLQAVGNSYSTLNWLSAYTGLPTILGWQDHELGWRYSSTENDEINRRTTLVQTIYQSSTASELQENASNNNVSYIMLGPDEISQYSPNIRVFQSAFGQPVYKNATIAIYRT